MATVELDGSRHIRASTRLKCHRMVNEIRRMKKCGIVLFARISLLKKLSLQLLLLISGFGTQNPAKTRSQRSRRSVGHHVPLPHPLCARMHAATIARGAGQAIVQTTTVCANSLFLCPCTMKRKRGPRERSRRAPSNVEQTHWRLFDRASPNFSTCLDGREGQARPKRAR